MRIFTHLKSNWIRYGFETIAVVVGILAAFALENWGDEQEQKKEEYIILENLLNDLRNAKENSSEYINTEKQAKELLIQALNMNSSNEAVELPANADSIFTRITWDIAMESPVIYSYTDLKNTGNAGLISSQEIRKGLTNLESSIYSLGKTLDDRLAVHQLRVDEIAASELNFVRSLDFDIPELKMDQERQNNYHQLFENPKIRNLLAMKLSLTDGVIKLRMELHEDILSLIALLEKEIAQF